MLKSAKCVCWQNSKISESQRHFTLTQSFGVSTTKRIHAIEKGIYERDTGRHKWNPGKGKIVSRVQGLRSARCRYSQGGGRNKLGARWANLTWKVHSMHLHYMVSTMHCANILMVSTMHYANIFMASTMHRTNISTMRTTNCTKISIVRTMHYANKVMVSIRHYQLRK